MREPDFSCTCGLLQMFIGTLYFHKNHILTKVPWLDFYQNDLKVEKPLFWANFDIIMLIMRKRVFFFKNPALLLFSPYSALTSYKKAEKSYEPFLRKLVH